MANSVFSTRILVVSLGNPLPKYSGLHSAAHHAFNGIVRRFDDQPPFTRQRFAGQYCQVSDGPLYTYVQSPTLMNVSGPFVARAWKSTLEQYKEDYAALVVVHDELEKEFGDVSLAHWDMSHKGHNGVRSVKEHVTAPKRYKRDQYKRVRIGIGRPGSRSSEDVSQYVLAPISDETRSQLENEISGKLAFVLLHNQIHLEAKWLGIHTKRALGWRTAIIPGYQG